MNIPYPKTTVAVITVLMVSCMAQSNKDGSASTSSTTKVETPRAPVDPQMTPEVAKVAEKLRGLDPSLKSLTITDIITVGVYGKTKDALRDPGSMEIISALAGPSKKGLVGCLEFRSRNGFGGMNTGYAAWTMDTKGTMRHGIDNASLWNSWCKGTTLEDVTSKVRHINGGK